MTRGSLIRVGTGALFLLYPFLVYLGLKEFQPRLLATMLIIVTILRLVAWKDDKGMTLYWIGAASLAALFTLVSGSEIGLYFYPLLVNLTFFTFFSISLFNPPTVIEKIARRLRPELPEYAVVYTRTVTKVWSVFFLINGALSVVSLYFSDQWWMLYNGLISYCLIALLLAVEYLVRMRVKRHHND
jgi:uncharacterized membrane protein